MTLYEKDGKAYFDRVNQSIVSSRKYFNEMGCHKSVPKGDLTETKAANLLYCDKYIIQIYVKYGLLRADKVNGKCYFNYQDICDFANDNRFLDEFGKIPDVPGYANPAYIDKQGRQIVIPTVVWIDKDGNETEKPNPNTPPVKWVSRFWFGGSHRQHTFGIGWRAEGYYMKPSEDDILLMQNHNLYSDENEKHYKELC